MEKWMSEVVEVEVGQGTLFSAWTSLGGDCSLVRGSFRVKLRDQHEKIIEGIWEISLSRRDCLSGEPGEASSISEIGFRGPDRQPIQHDLLSVFVWTEIRKRIIDTLDITPVTVVFDRVKRQLLWRMSKN